MLDILKKRIFTPMTRRYVILCGAVFIGICIVVLGIPFAFRIIEQRYVYNSLNLVPSAQTALVLGASVEGKIILSPILAKRADTAILLYKNHKVSKILVSGDNATLSYDEVNPVGRYLVSHGVAPQDIFLDHAGFNTYSSMYRAKVIFSVSSLIITSQSFHLPRALYIAHSLGISAYGFVAQGGGAWNSIREIPASDKAFLDILLRQTPKYLGSRVPITGNGETTWY